MGFRENVRRHYLQSSLRSAHILHIPKVISQSGEDSSSHLKQSSSISCYQDSPHWGAKQLVAIQSELIYSEASWEHSLLNETRLKECGLGRVFCQTFPSWGHKRASWRSHQTQHSITNKTDLFPWGGFPQVAFEILKPISFIFQMIDVPWHEQSLFYLAFILFL